MHMQEQLGLLLAQKDLLLLLFTPPPPFSIVFLKYTLVGKAMRIGGRL